MARIPQRHTRSAKLITAAACTAIVILSGCSDSGNSDEDAAGANQPTAEQLAGEAPMDPGSRQTTTTEAVPLPEGTAGEVTAQLQETVPLNSAEAACVADALDADTKTLSELAEGLDPNRDAYQQAVTLAADCTAKTTYIPKLIASLDAQADLSDEQAQCLTAALGEFGPERLTTLTLGGTLEDGTTLGSIAEGCGINR